MSQKTKKVVLACTYGVGKSAKQPGEIAELLENEANRLIKTGYASEPHVVTASDSELDDLRLQIEAAQFAEGVAKKAAADAEKAKTEAESKMKESQQSEKAAKKAAADAEKAAADAEKLKAEAESKLEETVAYAKILEDLCNANKIKLPE